MKNQSSLHVLTAICVIQKLNTIYLQPEILTFVGIETEKHSFAKTVIKTYLKNRASLISYIVASGGLDFEYIDVPDSMLETINEINNLYVAHFGNIEEPSFDSSISTIH